MRLHDQTQAESPTANSAIPMTLQLLSARYPAVVELPIAAQECSIAHQTLLNQICKGTCPLPVFKQGRRWYVRLVDLAEYIDRRFLLSNPQQIARPKRGRPTKAEEIARRIANAAASA